MATPETTSGAADDGLDEITRETTSESEGVSEVQQEICRYYRFTFSVVIVGGLCVAGTVGNALALAVLRRFKETSKGSSGRAATALILSALAVMDALVLVSLLLVKSLPSLFYFSHVGEGYLAISPYLWQWGWPLNDLFHAYSTWITVLVAVQRCVAVTFPHRAKSVFTYSATRGLIILVIVVVTLFQLPTFLDYKLVTVKDENNQTYLARVFTKLGEDHTYQIAYKTTAYYLAIYIIPILLLAVLSFILIRALRRAKAKRTDMTQGQPSKEDDVTKSLLLVVIVCIICQPWEPTRRVMEALLMGQPGCGHFYFYFEEFPSLSFAINSSVNFFIYCLSGGHFRNILKDMFCGQSRSEVYSEQSSSLNTVSNNLSAAKCKGSSGTLESFAIAE